MTAIGTLSRAGEPIQPTYGQALARMIEVAKRTPLKPVDTEDAEVIAKVRHTMIKGERLLQWYARVGLGKPQIMNMTKDQIAIFVATAEINRKNETLPSAESFEPRRPPLRFVMIE